MRKQWFKRKELDELGLPAQVKVGVLLAWLLAMLASLIIFVWLMMSFPRWWIVHKLGGGQEQYETGGSRLSRTWARGRGEVNTPGFVPERFTLDPRFAVFLVSIHGQRGAEVIGESLTSKRVLLKDDVVRVYQLDLSWQYRGRSFFAPTYLERIVAAEFFIASMHPTLGSSAEYALTNPLNDVPREDIAAIKAALRSHFATGSLNTPADPSVRTWFTDSLKPGWFSLGHDIIWGGVAANLLLLVSVVMGPLAATMLVLLIRRKWRRAVAKRKLSRSICSQCGYSLVTLPASADGFVQCPECGHSLATAGTIDAAKV